MGCCNKTKQIIEGTIKQTLRIKHEFYNYRLKICIQCAENTYMSRREYLDWLLHSGITFKKLPNFLKELEKLPKLPRYNQTLKRKILFCRICKCDLYKKTLVKGASCTLKKW